MYKLKQISFFLLAMALTVSCSNTAEVSDTPANESPESNLFSIEKSMLDNTKMSLGEISAQEFFDVVQANGSIEVPMSAKAEISPMVAGFVKQVPFLVGDKVNAGDLLVELQNPEFIKMQQNYLETKEEFQFVQAEYERQKTLSEENISSTKNFQKASSDYKLKLAQLNGLRETLKLFKVDLNALEKGEFTSSMKIYSPISGFISFLEAPIGAYVAPGDVLMMLINTSHKHLELEVFEKDVLKIAKGQQIRFRVPDAGSAYYKGTVFQVNKSIDSQKKTLLVHGHLADEEANFLQGMYVEADILTDGVKGLAVPSRAVFEEDGAFYILRYVETTDSDYVFEKTEVKLGKANEQYTQLLNSELKEGDRILDKGVFRLIGN